MPIIVGIYEPGTSEYNLFNMCKGVLQKAFAKHRNDKGLVKKVAATMGISDKQVYALLDKFELRDLLIQKPLIRQNGIR